MNVSGGVLHTHTRNPLRASLPKEALEELARKYDEVLAMHTLPVLDVTPDGPQNQIESNTAIGEAEVLSECEETEK